jgi:Polysaccharide deacetylase
MNHQSGRDSSKAAAARARARARAQARTAAEMQAGAETGGEASGRSARTGLPATRAARRSRSGGVKLTRRFYVAVAAVLIVILLIVIIALASSGGSNSSFQAAITTASALNEADLNTMKVNELGSAMVLEYHRIGEEGRWSRSPENFRSDLDLLYSEGYRAVRLADYVNGKINVPAGCSPVMFTFDDADPSQFRYIDQDGQQVIDPRCGVGVMEDFKKVHPDFNMTATFYVLPTLFGQDDLIDTKLHFLVDNGYDIGNHTVNHPSLSTLSDAKVVEELAGNVSMVQKYLPNYQETSIALPNGEEPKNPELLKEGSANGTSYHLIASLLVGANPSPAPWDTSFDPMRMPRIQALDPSLDKGNAGILAWLNYFMENPERRYISDGDASTVTIPKHMEDRIDKSRLGDLKLRTY